MARQKGTTKQDAPLLMTAERTAAYLGRSVFRVYEGGKAGLYPRRPEARDTSAILAAGN